MPKRQKRDDAPHVDDVGKIHKPGLVTNHAHIATMFASAGQMDVAESITYPLFDHLAKRVCVAIPRRKRVE